MKLPYIDDTLDFLQNGHSGIEKIFGRNIHWGYWDTPKTAQKNEADFALASERMTEKVVAAAEPLEGKHVLDVGCGFGGTLDHIDQKHAATQLFGINIDTRQLVWGLKSVVTRARNNNQMSFVASDAVELPFHDSQFDVVFAVECIFHFSSREKFLAEAYRVLKPYGRLVISDVTFIRPAIPLAAFIRRLSRSSPANTLLGDRLAPISTADYCKIARSAGFSSMKVEDITKNVEPTYRVLADFFDRTYPNPLKFAYRRMLRNGRTASQLGIGRYQIFSLVK